jgi:type IV fimbrial biogenesis protein FimT
VIDIKLTHGRRSAACSGVTLLELLTVMAVLVGLLTVATPFVSAVRGSIQLSSATADLLVHLHQARSEAIKRNGRAAICKSLDGLSCTTTNGWEQGWIVFHDNDNDAQRDPSERIVSRVQKLPDGMRVAGNDPVRNYVSFDDTGGTRSTSGAFLAGTFTLCRISASPGEGRKIVINAVGRPRTVRTGVTCS